MNDTARAAALLSPWLLVIAACGGAPHPTGAACACGAGAPEVAPHARVISGPMLGYATMREATVWLQTDGVAGVAVSYWAVGSTGLPLETTTAVRTTPPHATVSTADHTHIVHVSGLEPGQEYGYAVVVDGARVDPPAGSTLSTQPLWRWQATPPQPPDLTIAFGSCNYVNDAPYDRAGRPYGAGHEIFEAIADLEPDFMLWLGDNTYFREVDWQSRAGMAARYSRDRAIPELRRLLATTAHYATWDDHDYGPDDSDRSFALRTDALGVFQSFWANPSYGTLETPGVFTRFTWGDVEVFLLDDRFYRAPTTAPDEPGKPYLGDAQLEWIVDALTSSRATFKLVAAGGQFINGAHPFESYGRFSDERERFFDAIVARRIPGVVFLSGDRHFSELNRRDPPGSYPLYDFTSSPLTSGPGGPDPTEAEISTRVPGTAVEDTRSFGLVRVTGPWGSRTLAMSAHDASGAALWSVEVPEDALVPPPVAAE